MRNWKTTLLGLALGFGFAFQDGLSGGLTPKNALLGAGLAALGLVAKDFNVSGPAPTK